MVTRRRFLQSTAAGSMLGGLDPTFGFRAVSAAEAKLDSRAVQFGSDIEPLVRLIEETPREKLIEEIATQVHGGLAYRKLLTAILLAGVRNVQPRPAVGFKFHAVLVVNSAHLASLASSDHDRWLPIFWAIDYFKSSQERDVEEGNWTMSTVDESAVPSATHARAMFLDAMDRWDEDQADVAVAGLYRTTGSNAIFELMARYGARDFRSIGHKAIYVANSYRTLQCIGWQHAEPVLRSLAYALLNHENEPNPATSDLGADRPWRENVARAERIRSHWLAGRIDTSATSQLLSTFRAGTSEDACEQVVEMLNADVHPQSLYDAMFLAAGEFVMRQPGIVALHAVTSTNALRYAFSTCADDQTRRMILLQNAAFLPLFRQSMVGRGNLGDLSIDAFSASLPENEENAIQTIFDEVGKSPRQAAEHTLSYLQQGGDAESLMAAARRFVFAKGTDSHDYKFSSAVLEDYYQVSPTWRDRFLASSVFQLRGASDKDNGLVERIRSAMT